MTTSAERSPTPSAFLREKPPTSSADAPTRWSWALDLALALPALFILAGWLIVALAHIDDRYEVGHGQGAWMALARHANVSGLYPELFDGTSYGGTRHMPLAILAHAALARLTGGEYLTSGKLLGLLATVGVVIVTFFLLRSIGCRWSWALALSALAVGGFAGLRAGTTIGGEPLPVMFGVAALAVILRSQRHPALIAAAVLTALGVCAKLSALWAPAAIVAGLFFIERRRAAVFAAYAVGATALLLGAFDVLSDGRMVENLVNMWGAGVQGPGGVFEAPARLLYFVVDGEPAVWALIPIVAYAGATKRWPVGAVLFAIAWLVAAAILIVVFADVGTGPNQLFDLAVLTSLCVGAVVAFTNVAQTRDRLLVSILAATVVWSGMTAAIVRIRPPVQEAIIAEVKGEDTYPTGVLATQLSSAGSVLSEDPGLLVENDRTPVVFDPFMLRRLADTHPDEVEQLVRRIEGREFDLVVLVVPLRGPADPWWRDFHFGTDVISAVDDAYRFDERIGAYYLYRPKP